MGERRAEGRREASPRRQRRLPVITPAVGGGPGRSSREGGEEAAETQGGGEANGRDRGGDRNQKEVKPTLRDGVGDATDTETQGGRGGEKQRKDETKAEWSEGKTEAWTRRWGVQQTEGGKVGERGPGADETDTQTAGRRQPKARQAGAAETTRQAVTGRTRAGETQRPSEDWKQWGEGSWAGSQGGGGRARGWLGWGTGIQGWGVRGWDRAEESHAPARGKRRGRGHLRCSAVWACLSLWSGPPSLTGGRRELPLGKAEAGPRTLGVWEIYLRPLGPAAWTCLKGSRLEPTLGPGGPKSPHLPMDEPHSPGEAPALPLVPAPTTTRCLLSLTLPPPLPSPSHCSFLGKEG